MITVKQILEHYKMNTDKETPTVSKLNQLSEAGLFDAARLPMMQRALMNNPRDMTMVEKKALIELSDSLMAEVLKESFPQDHLSKMDPRFPKKFPSDKNIPSMIILKRKAIRVFPDNQKIALYYSQALDKYVSIPFGKGSESMGIHVNEQTKELSFSKTEEIKEDSPISGSFKENLARLREQKELDENLPAIASAASRLARKALSAGSEVAGKAGSAIKKLLKVKPKSKSSKPDDTKTSSGSSYNFSAAGRAKNTISSPERTTADLSVAYSQRQQNKAAWKNIQESNFNIIKKTSKSESNGTVVFGENSISINNRISKRIMNLYESLNDENKRKTRNMVNESAESFRKIVNFAIRQDNGK